MKFALGNPLVASSTILLLFGGFPKLDQGSNQTVAQAQSRRCNEVYIAVQANNKPTLELSKDFINYFKKISKKNSKGYRFTVDILEGDDILTPYSNEDIDSKVFNYIHKILDTRLDEVKAIGGFPDNDTTLVNVFDRLIELSDNSKQSGYPGFYAYILTEGTANRGRPNDQVANQIESKFRQAVRYDPNYLDNLQVNIIGVQQNRFEAVRFLNPIAPQAHSASAAKTEWERLANSYINSTCSP